MEKDWNVYPVFHVDFNSTNFTEKETLEQKLNFYVTEWELEYGLPDRSGLLGIGDRFVEVLRAAHEQTGLRSVVLIDEYDKPILDVLDVDAFLEDRHRNILKAFYSVFKGADSHLQFVLLTGVIRISVWMPDTKHCVALHKKNLKHIFRSQLKRWQKYITVIIILCLQK